MAHRLSPLALLALVLLGHGLAAAPAKASPGPGSAQAAAPRTIPVRSLDAVVFYARRGFDPGLTAAVPRPPANGWVISLPHPGRSLAVRDLGLPGVERPAPFDLSNEAPEEFTLLTVFEADQDLLDSPGPSILIPKIGLGWEAYLNGQAFHRELHRGPDGELEPERSLRNPIIPLDKRSLRLGANILAFRVYGNPEDDRTGITGGKDLMVGPFSALSNKVADFIDVVLIGVYFLFAVYHLVLFLLRPRQKPYLAFGLGAVLFSIYIFARSGPATSVIQDTAFLRIIEYTALFFIFPFFVAFCEVTLGRRVSWFSWTLIGLGFVLSGLLHLFRVEAVKFIWEAFTAILIIYVHAFVLIPDFVAKVRAGEGSPGLRFWRALSMDSGLLFIGTFVVALTSSIDAIDINRGGDLQYTKYSFLVYIIGTAVILARQFSGVSADLAVLRHTLERKVAERNADLEAAVERQKRLGAEIEHQRQRLVNAKDVSERDLLIAERVQRGFFPSTAPEAATWDLALAYQPAAGVSGDFFDFFLAEDGEGRKDLAGLVIGDVQGMGMGPGLVAVLARSIAYRRWLSLRGTTLGVALSELDRELRAELGGVGKPLACALLRCEGDKLEYANGAFPDLLFRRAGSREAKAALPKGSGDFRGPLLGLPAEPSPGAWSSLRFGATPGDLFFLGTEGLEAAANPAGELFGRQRLLECLSASPSTTAQDILDDVVGAVAAFRSGAAATGDLTAIILIKR